MEKAFDFFINAIDDIQCVISSLDWKFRKNLFNLIEIMQSESGYVSFTDESSYPLFINYTKDMYENVTAVRVVNNGSGDDIHRVLQGKTNEDDEWFDLVLYGKVSLTDIYECLKRLLNK
jgi:hypothetical protein